MLDRLLPRHRRRRQPPRGPVAVTDARSGVPERRGLAPMPRMRWYS